MSNRLRTAALTQQGISRGNNEDCVSIRDITSERYAILCLSDGIGGLEDGEAASRIVVETMCKQISSSPMKTLSKRMVRADKTISSRSKRCGSTVSVVAIDKNTLKFDAINIGDSRIYLLRGRSVVMLSKDDKPIHDNGYTQNVLTNAVGMKKHILKHNIISGTLEIGDILLLLSDGAYAKLNDEDFLDLRILHAPENYLVRLAEYAVTRKSQDDISIALCIVCEE
jgi:protein phosphatase